MTPEIVARWDRVEAIFGSHKAAAERLGITREKLRVRVYKPYYKPYLSLLLHAPWSTIECGDYSAAPLPNEEALQAIIAQHDKVYRDCVGSRRHENFEAFKSAYPESPITTWIETNRLSKLHKATQPAGQSASVEKADSSRLPESPCGHCNCPSWEVGAKSVKGRIVAYFAVCSSCKRRCGAPNRYWPLNPAFALKHAPQVVAAASSRGLCQYYGCQNAADDKHHYAPKSIFGTEADAYGVVNLCKFHHAKWHRMMNDWKRVTMLEGVVYAVRTWAMDGSTAIASIHTTMRDAQTALAQLTSSQSYRTVEVQVLPVLATSHAVHTEIEDAP